MKANEAPKSKFVYPDKLYARTNNNITLDISYAPQTLEAVEYVRTDAFIEQACKKLEKCMYDNLMFQGRLHRKEVIETFIEDFKKAMEEGNL